MIHGVSIEDDSVAVKPGETRPRHHPLAHDGREFKTYREGIHTMYDSIVDSAERFGMLSLNSAN